jgi:thioredoxin 1
MGGFFKSLFGRKEEPEVEAEQGAEAVEIRAPLPEMEPLHVNDETFEAMVLNAELPALVDFWAPWCGPCRMVAPIVSDLAREYEGQAVIAKVNTDESAGMASKLGIMGIPTLILFKDGKEVDRVVGYVPHATLEEKLRAVLN